MPAPVVAAPDAVLTDYGVRPACSTPAVLETVAEAAPLTTGGLPNGHHRPLSVGSGSGSGAAVAAAAAEEYGIVPGTPSGRDLVAQRGVCGAVRVACRTLCPDAVLRHSVSDQQTVRGSGGPPA